MNYTDSLLDDVHNLYHIPCIMPKECVYVKTENSILKRVSDDHLHIYNSALLRVNIHAYIQHEESNNPLLLHQQNVSFETLGDQLGFQYTRHLIFFSMKDLLNSDEWQISPVEYADNDNQLASIKQFLRQGEVISDLLIQQTSTLAVAGNIMDPKSSNASPVDKPFLVPDGDSDFNHIGSKGTITNLQPLQADRNRQPQHQLRQQQVTLSPAPVRPIGYGLYTNSKILNNTFIGEYTGIVSSGGKYNSNDDINEGGSSMSNYRLCYPSTDGGFAIDAAEYGNVTRFINHSWRPNCEIRNIFLDGIIHCVFVSNNI